MTEELQARLAEVVWVDPGRMSGAPCFRETRVPVEFLVRHLAASGSIEDFLEGYPTVSRREVEQFLVVAAQNTLDTVAA